MKKLTHKNIDLRIGYWLYDTKETGTLRKRYKFKIAANIVNIIDNKLRLHIYRPIDNECVKVDDILATPKQLNLIPFKYGAVDWFLLDRKRIKELRNEQK
jgi:hypothetical protein